MNSVFLERQQQKLDELIKRIPASQRSIYNDRIRQLQSSITRKEAQIRHPEQIRKIKKTLQSEDKALNKHINSRGAHLYTNINKFAKPNIDSVSRKVLVTKQYLLAPVPYSRELVKPIQRPISKPTV
jgi:hypothetical protein